MNITSTKSAAVHSNGNTATQVGQQIEIILWREYGAEQSDHQRGEEQCVGAYRAFRLRQVHLSQNVEPDERSHRRSAYRGRSPTGRRGYFCAGR